MVHIEDLKAFSKIGMALCPDPESSKKTTIETLTAVSILDLTPDRALEKAALALLEKARKRGLGEVAQNQPELLLSPFFRLSPEERLILAALHEGGWSYRRLARILELEAEQIERLAWKARLQLCLSMPYPTGPTSLGPSCPSYEPARPWTQRFLDEEIGANRDRIFLQHHLFACGSCRDALSRCRKIYFRVDQEIASILGNPDYSNPLETIFRQAVLFRTPGKITFRESLSIFFLRKDIRWIVAALFVLTVLKFI